MAICLVGGDKRQLALEVTRIRTLFEEATDVEITDIVLEWL